MISVTENEGNARLTAALPKTMITLVGIEKVVPRFEDLGLFLPMLAKLGAGQLIHWLQHMYGGPRQPGESDGPEEFHVVLLDNQRTTILADPEQRDSLHCIRCGACLNVCPIYRNVGGHTYHTTYPGPIGSVITPSLRGTGEWGTWPTLRLSVALARRSAPSKLICTIICCKPGAISRANSRAFSRRSPSKFWARQLTAASIGSL